MSASFYNMKFLATIFAILFSSVLQAQTIKYQNLLDTAITFNGQLFVDAKPITEIRLDQNELRNYFYIFRDYEKSTLDTIMLLEIISNSKKPDTTVWLDTELNKFILVNDRNENVDLKYVIHKFQLIDKKQIKFYRQKVNKINSTDNYDKNIYSYSRPVFDNSKNFAIIQWDNGHSGLGGGGGIILYQFTEGNWKRLGNITFWKY